jgi:hypothetical protein
MAVAAASLLVGGTSPAKNASLGVIIHADRAHVGEAVASVGSTIFDGDRLSTESGGMLRITLPAVTLQLGAQSSAALSHATGSEGNILVELAAGTLVFSAAPTGSIVVAADEALVHPAVEIATVAHVRVVNRKELRIYAQRGALEFTYHGESEIIAEGKTYRVFLDPTGQELAAAVGSEGPGKTLAKHHATFILVAIAVAVGVAIPLLMRGSESPDSPGPPRTP